MQAHKANRTTQRAKYRIINQNTHAAIAFMVVLAGFASRLAALKDRNKDAPTPPLELPAAAYEDPKALAEFADHLAERLKAALQDEPDLLQRMAAVDTTRDDGVVLTTTTHANPLAHDLTVLAQGLREMG